jgi:hypothetical protein
MSRFRRALACAAMAIAAAGAGLAAGATPAYAATPAHPAGGHTTTTSFTAVPAAQATGRIGPKFQCGDTCDPNGGGNPPPPPTITCTIFADYPFHSDTGVLVFESDTTCTGNVARITMQQTVVHNPGGGTLTSSADVPNDLFARTVRTAPCVTAPDSWSVSASATITPPAGWVIVAGHNPIVASNPVPTSFMNCNSSSGGGGGGGCAIGTPSVPAHPAARQPKVVTC